MIENVEDIVIVGAGPAGSYLGYLLAKAGFKPVIFDHSHPREKPCGGGISVLAIEKFSFLHDIPDEKSPDNFFEIVSPHGVSIMTTGRKSTWNLSRQSLDIFVLDKAINHGCRLIAEQVIDVKLINNIWHIKTKEAKYKAKIIIGADGVNSIVRKKILGPIPKTELGVCYGCFAKSEKKETNRVKFLKNKQGYAWCFPRHDHLSIGVGIESGHPKEVKKMFNNFLFTYYPHVEIISTWGAKIPNIKNPHFYDLPCAGENWILIGDAAGHVDPMTGEGITYALWSAELAAKAIISNDPKAFDKMWRKEYGEDLMDSCRMMKFFYNPRLIEYSIHIAKKSKTFSTFLYDFMTNQISRQRLLKRIIKDIPKIVKEYILSTL